MERPPASPTRAISPTASNRNIPVREHSEKDTPNVLNCCNHPQELVGNMHGTTEAKKTGRSSEK
jgi:hypothetical protein